jgi:hypothetical protein
MAQMVSSPLLPVWLRAGWAIVLAAVAVLHLAHVVTMRGQRRWWHAGHTVMAVGMAGMYLVPRMSPAVLHNAGLGVFAVLALLVAVMTARIASREGVLNPLWATTVLDMLAMTYMLAPLSAWVPLVTHVLAGYLGCQVVAWATGLWTRVPVLSRSRLALAEEGGRTRIVATSDESTRTVALTGQSSPMVLTSLSIMAAGMAYMLIAM